MYENQCTEYNIKSMVYKNAILHHMEKSCSATVEHSCADAGHVHVAVSLVVRMGKSFMNFPQGTQHLATMALLSMSLRQQKVAPTLSRVPLTSIWVTGLPAMGWSSPWHLPGPLFTKL